MIKVNLISTLKKSMATPGNLLTVRQWEWPKVPIPLGIILKQMTRCLFEEGT